MSNFENWDVKPVEPEDSVVAEEEEPRRPSFLSTVNPWVLYTLAFLMTASAVLVIWVLLPSRQSELQKSGIKTDGEVKMKMEDPLGDGRTIYSVMFTYVDDQRKNHDAENQISKGMYDGLKTNQSVTVYYLPNQLGVAFIKDALAVINRDPSNGQRRTTPVQAPHSAAISFVAWTALWGSIPVWILGWMAAHTPRYKKRKGVIMARRR